jgi:hypothetical protein
MRRTDSPDERGEARHLPADLVVRRTALRRGRRWAARTGQVTSAAIILVSASAVLAATADIVLGH